MLKRLLNISWYDQRTQKLKELMEELRGLNPKLNQFIVEQTKIK